MSIPVGNTQPGVNEAVLALLDRHHDRAARAKVLDIPCGKGDVLAYLAQRYPDWEFWGGDYLALNPAPKTFHFSEVDASKPFQCGPKGEFDLALSISGVMEFDNTGLFLDQLRDHLRLGGLLVLTNDTVQTVRDRISFLLFGKFKRFALNLYPGFSTYKAIPVQELYKMIRERGFQIREIRYCALRTEDWFLAPLALPIYLFQRLYALREPGPMPRADRLQLFSFRSLLARHVIFVAECRK